MNALSRSKWNMDISRQRNDPLSQQPSSWSGCEWVLGLILLAAVILTYQPVWYAGFIWDDEAYVTANPTNAGLIGLKEIWTIQAASICPLVLTTFWVEHALWGLQPLPYHLVNVLMQGACAVVLWRVLRSLQIPGAWLGAALWALHPVQVESTAWVAELKNTQSGLFYLLAILFFVKGLKARKSDDRKSWNWNYALTLLFAALAMASKSSTVVLPVVLCLCAWWVEGRWHWRNLVIVAPIFLMSVVASGVTMWPQTVDDPTDPQIPRSWPERLATAGDAVWFYLGKLLWPYPLSAIYPRWQIDASQWASYLPLLAVMIVLIILWLNRRSWARPYFFAFGYFLVTMLPVLGLIEQNFWRFSFVEDHLQYLASIGPLALSGAGLAMLADFTIAERTWLQSTLCAGLLLVLGIVSWQRSWVYESQETFWTDTLAKNPNCWTAHYNLANAIIQNGRVDEAISHYQKTLEINPRYAYAHNNLGAAFMVKGRLDEAIEEYQKALKGKPTDAEAHYNLGNALFRKGRTDEAIAHYEEAIRLKPNYTNAQNNLAAVKAMIRQKSAPK